jgi:hypothetical protein
MGEHPESSISDVTFVLRGEDVMHAFASALADVSADADEDGPEGLSHLQESGAHK